MAISKYCKNARAEKWSETEIRLVRDSENKTYKEIGVALNRSEAAVAIKTNQLKIKRYNKWTDSEVETLKKIYSSSTTKEIKELLSNHSIGSINKKAEKLGLRRNNIARPKWTEDEFARIKEMYGCGHDIKYISKAMGRPERAIGLEIGRIKAKKNHWTDSELLILKNNFERLNNYDLMKLIPDKTYYQIAYKGRQLGFKKPVSFVWSEDETDLLKSKYSIKTMKELLGMFPNKTKNQIRKKAKFLKLTKTKDTYNRCFNSENTKDWPASRRSKWRKAVLIRDNYTCRECGAVNKTGKTLHIHHIIPKRDCSEELLYSTNNGISLCINCHKQTVNDEYRFIKKYYKIAMEEKNGFFK